MLKAALNGGRTRGSHPALPLRADQLAADAAACARAGAAAIHIHPRDDDDRETSRTLSSSPTAPGPPPTRPWSAPPPISSARHATNAAVATTTHACVRVPASRQPPNNRPANPRII